MRDIDNLQHELITELWPLSIPELEDTRRAWIETLREDGATQFAIDYVNALAMAVIKHKRERSEQDEFERILELYAIMDEHDCDMDTAELLLGDKEATIGENRLCCR